MSFRTWNYRIIAHEYDDEIEYGIHEVYYDEKGEPQEWSTEPVPFVSDTVEGLQELWSKVRRGLQEPVFVADEFGVIRERAATEGEEE